MQLSEIGSLVSAQGTILEDDIVSSCIVMRRGHTAAVSQWRDRSWHPAATWISTGQTIGGNVSIIYLYEFI